MIKCKETLVEAANLFISNNKIEIKYSNDLSKKLGYGHQIYVNGKRVFKNEIGNMAFMYCETVKPFKKKWATLPIDLQKQILSLIKIA